MDDFYRASKMLYRYVGRFAPDEPEVIMESDIPREEWGYGTKITVYNKEAFDKKRKRFNKWYSFFCLGNKKKQASLKLLYGTPMPKEVHRAFSLPEKFNYPNLEGASEKES